MKVKFTVLYKNGHQDEIVQEGTAEEIKRVITTFEISFQENKSTYISFGDGEKACCLRVSDVSRVSWELL